MRNYFLLKLVMLITLAVLSAQPLFAMGPQQEGGSQDPFRNINYRAAFDPSVNAEHAEILRVLGLYENAIGERPFQEPSTCGFYSALACVKANVLELFSRCSEQQPVAYALLQAEGIDLESGAAQEGTPEDILESQQFHDYVDARLEQLADARKTAVLQPAKSALQTALVLFLSGVV